VPAVGADPDRYASAVREELARDDYLAVFPASDPAVLALRPSLRRFLDKVSCARAAVAVGLQVPPSRLFPSAEALLDEAATLDYPVIVKPDIKRAMAVRASSSAALAARLVPLLGQPGAVIVQPWLTDQLHGVVGLMWRGQVLASMHMRYQRIWPLPCGTVSAAETIAADLELEDRLAQLLAGYDGVFHADLAGPFLLDLNPRIHATLPLALAAGVDPVAGYCDVLLGIERPPARARPGVFFRWIEGDVRSVVRGWREGHFSTLSALHALRPRRGVVHGYESWRDPGPAVTRLRYAARRLLRGAPVTPA
jgi:hypothetical protein